MTDSKSQFSFHVWNYEKNIAAYRDFLDHLTPAVANLENQAERSFNDKVAQLTRSAKRELEKDELIAVHKTILLLSEVYQKNSNGDDEVQMEQPSDEAKPESDEEVSEQELNFSLTPKAGSVLIRFLKVIQSKMPMGVQSELLYRGVLTGLVGSFEVLFSDVIHEFYLRAPGAIESDENVLTVADLRQFENIDEALSSVIAKKVDSLLRESLVGWHKFMKSRLKIDLEELAPDWDRFGEFFQRRHLIVHAGGRISRQYMLLVPQHLQVEFFEDPKVGQIASLSEGYVWKALSSFEVVGLRLGFEAWLKLRPEEAVSVQDKLGDVIYDALVEGRWDTARALARWGREQETFVESSRMVFQMNEWLAAKRLGAWEEVKAEVEAFDTSALQGRYALARAALLEETDRFFELLENEFTALESQAWDDWPIFEEVRDDPRFPEYRARWEEETGENEGAKEWAGEERGPEEVRELEPPQ